MIDLSQLPPPSVVEQLDFEAVLAALRADVVALDPELEPALSLESDPIIKLLEVAAYRELILRQRINDAARAVMLPYAQGADLDNLSALFGVERLDGEPDESLRKRTQIAPEGTSVAGPTQSYIYHALSASPDVRDASVTSPDPGLVRVALLSQSGTPGVDLITRVNAALSADDARPLCDKVEVVPAEILAYTVRAMLMIEQGPEKTLVLQNAQAACQAYVDRQFMLGRRIAESALHAALHQSGVVRVDLIEPGSDIVCANHQAPRCDGIVLSDGNG